MPPDAAHAHGTHVPGHALDHAAGLDPGMMALAALVVALLVLYAVAWGQAHRRGRPWPWPRPLSFALGAAMVVAALVPPLAPLAHADLRAHMYQHLLLGMIGPIFLVLGMPVTLALRALPTRVARLAIGVLHSPPLRLLTHPLVALVLNIGGMAALYLTPLYAQMTQHHGLHMLVHVHFVAAGSLFAWAVLGLEPAGRPAASPYLRLATIFLAIATHGMLCKAMFAYGHPRGTAHALAELEAAAQIMYYGGDLSELVLMVILFATWQRRGNRRVAASRDFRPALV